MEIIKLKRKYDSLYDKITKLLKEKNLCEFNSDGLCKRSRLYIQQGLNKKDVMFCCCGNPEKLIHKNTKEFCKYFAKGKGCSTKSIACKLWFCKEVVIPKNIKRRINKITNKAKRYGFLVFRGNFNSFLNSKGM
jgi:hypothetical protein